MKYKQIYFFSDEDVATLLDAANWAPTHHRSEPWRYVVIPGPGPIIQYLEFIDSWYSNHRYLCLKARDTSILSQCCGFRKIYSGCAK